MRGMWTTYDPDHASSPQLMSSLEHLSNVNTVSIKRSLVLKYRRDIPLRSSNLVIGGFFGGMLCAACWLESYSGRRSLLQ